MNPDAIDERDVWRYVHSQMPAEECAAMRAAMERDPPLSRAVERIRALDTRLRELVPAAALTDESLAHRVMADMAASPPAASGTGREAARTGRLIRFPFVRGWTRHRLARYAVGGAAAALLLAVALPHLPSSPIRWEAPCFDSALSRGAAPDGPATFTRAEADAGFRLLRASVNKAARRQLASRPAEPWVLEFHFQQLIDGNGCIRVQSGGEQATAATEWIVHFADMESLAGQVDAFAERIVKGLLDSSREP